METGFVTSAAGIPSTAAATAIHPEDHKSHNRLKIAAVASAAVATEPPPPVYAHTTTTNTNIGWINSTRDNLDHQGIRFTELKMHGKTFFVIREKPQGVSDQDHKESRATLPSENFIAFADLDPVAAADPTIEPKDYPPFQMLIHGIRAYQQFFRSIKNDPTGTSYSFATVVEAMALHTTPVLIDAAIDNLGETDSPTIQADIQLFIELMSPESLNGVQPTLISPILKIFWRHLIRVRMDQLDPEECYSRLALEDVLKDIAEINDVEQLWLKQSPYLLATRVLEKVDQKNRSDKGLVLQIARQLYDATITHLCSTPDMSTIDPTSVYRAHLKSRGIRFSEASIGTKTFFAVEINALAFPFYLPGIYRCGLQAFNQQLEVLRRNLESYTEFSLLTPLSHEDSRDWFIKVGQSMQLCTDLELVRNIKSELTQESKATESFTETERKELIQLFSLVPTGVLGKCNLEKDAILRLWRMLIRRRTYTIDTTAINPAIIEAWLRRFDLTQWNVTMPAFWINRATKEGLKRLEPAFSIPVLPRYYEKTAVYLQMRQQNDNLATPITARKAKKRAKQHLRRALHLQNSATAAKIATATAAAPAAKK